MALLILNRRSIVESIPLWLAEFDLPLVLITASSAVTPEILDKCRHRYREIVAVDNYDAPSVEDLILETARRHNVCRILSSAEVDVLRAARVRERLGLSGQTVACAAAFRDKVLMKTLAAKAGIPVASMQKLTAEADLLDFGSRNGFPVVVKPLAGGGSVNVQIIASQVELEAYLKFWKSTSQREFVERQFMVESWVEGEFYTVDGLMMQGSILQTWPSRTTANLKAVLGPEPLISWMVSRHDPLRLRMNEFVARVVRALPATEEIIAFHAEAFHTGDDRLILCEIACRPGGCGHVPVYEHALGLNLYAESLRGQAGCTDPPANLVDRPRCMAGFGWFPPRNGILLQLPEVCPIPGAFSYSTCGRVGAIYDGARSVSDNIARALITGPAEDNLKPRLEALEAWWSDACTWLPNEAQSKYNQLYH